MDHRSRPLGLPRGMAGLRIPPETRENPLFGPSPNTLSIYNTPGQRSIGVCQYHF